MVDENVGHSFPDGYRLSFPARTNYMFALVKHPIPKLRAFTVCLWLRPAGSGIGTPLSYAVPEQPNEVVLLQGLHTPTELLINDKVTTNNVTELTHVAKFVWPSSSPEVVLTFSPDTPKNDSLFCGPDVVVHAWARTTSC